MQEVAFLEFCQTKGLRQGFEWHGKKVERIPELDSGRCQLHGHDFGAVEDQLWKQELTVEPFKNEEAVIASEGMCNDDGAFVGPVQ